MLRSQRYPSWSHYFPRRVRLRGFEFQLRGFGVRPKTHSHSACLAEVHNADYVVLLIGGRRGGTFIGSESSITNEEIRVAQKLAIPVIAFVKKSVETHRQTYKRNPKANFGGIVDDVCVFDFIDYVASGHEDNWLHQFEDLNDVVETLRAQFAHYLGLYSRGLRSDDRPRETRRLVVVLFPANLDGIDDEMGRTETTAMRKDLRIVYDAINSIIKADVADSAKTEQLKAIWVIARHGKATDEGAWINESRFKASAWSTSKGQRVFDQMAGTDWSGGYDSDEDSDGRPIGTAQISIKTSHRAACPGHALKYWVDALVSRHSEDAFDLFQRADMRLFSRQGKRLPTGEQRRSTGRRSRRHERTEAGES